MARWTRRILWCFFFTQDPKSKAIKMSQSLFTDKLRPATIPKKASPDDLLSEARVKVLRAINGSLNWLSSQSRPDLAVQTSLSQQAFPNPKIRHLRDANNASRRAKMHKDLVVSFEPISPENLCAYMLSLRCSICECRFAQKQGTFWLL